MKCRRSCRYVRGGIKLLQRWRAEPDPGDISKYAFSAQSINDNLVPIFHRFCIQSSIYSGPRPEDLFPMEENNVCSCEKGTYFDVRQARAVLLNYLYCGSRMMRSRSAEITHFSRVHGRVKSHHGSLVEKVHRWLPAFDSLLAKQSKYMGSGELRGCRILQI